MEFLRASDLPLFLHYFTDLALIKALVAFYFSLFYSIGGYYQLAAEFEYQLVHLFQILILL